MYIHGHHIVHIDHFGAARLCVTQQSLQLKEAGGSHQFQHIAMRYVQCTAATAIEELHHQLEDVVAYVIDLHRRRAAGIAQLRAEHALETWRCCDQYNLVAIEDFALHAAKDWQRVHITCIYIICSSYSPECNIA